MALDGPIFSKILRAKPIDGADQRRMIRAVMDAYSLTHSPMFAGPFGPANFSATPSHGWHLWRGDIRGAAAWRW
jgi:hypothetical protein